MSRFQAGAALFFDVDGVLLDSVKAKGDAFCSLFNVRHRAEVRDIHQRNGGMYRREKLALMIERIERRSATQEELDRLEMQYGALVFERVVEAPEISGARRALKQLVDRFPLHAVSASPEPELVSILRLRKLDDFFVSVHGYPAQKTEVIGELIAERGYVAAHCFVIGDSLRDAEAADNLGIPFVFIESSEAAVIDGCIARLPNLECLDSLLIEWQAKE